MSPQRSAAGSTYMQWAKLGSTAKFNLATSGVAGFPLADLGVTLEQLDINGPSLYGYEPLLQAISERYRVPQESVVTAVGTSLANYLALAAATEPGDEILIEQPTYDPLLAVAGYLGLAVKRFQRRPERNFAIDLDDLAMDAIGGLMPLGPGAPVPYRRSGPGGEYARFWDENRWPCQQPPWGTLNAVDLDEGKIVSHLLRSWIKELLE